MYARLWVVTGTVVLRKLDVTQSSELNTHEPGYCEEIHWQRSQAFILSANFKNILHHVYVPIPPILQFLLMLQLF